MAADGGIKIKLAVDKARNSVLFADAGSDFVDVLLSFLTLPLSAVRLVAGASSPGCLSTLCQGVSCLRENELLRFDACHDTLLRPRLEEEFRHGKYACSCYDAIVRSAPSLQGHGLDCRCWQVMARAAYVFDQKQGGGKFVEGNRRFVISDDLVIKPASTANTHLLLQTIDSGGIDRSYEEIEVCIGWPEVVCMLKSSFSSETIFTDTFLSKETEVRATVNYSSISQNDFAFKKSIGQNYIQHTSDEEIDASPQFSIKVFYDKHEKKVMYAECDHDFVDLLLSFLVYPVACVTKNLAGTSHLGCSLDNLYGSAVHLHANSLLAVHAFYKDTLLDPSIYPFKVGPSKRAIKKLFCMCSVPSCCSSQSFVPECSLCSPQFVNNGTYVVDDDLLIYQASAMLVMKHWWSRGKDSVLEMDIAITKQEAVDLLRATLSSKTALTDVFKSKLEDECKLSPMLQQNHFQIFVKLHTGKTITLDVENGDTIATVKHKINEKAGLHLPAGYPYDLVYGGRLPDSSTIADCNIGKGSTIHYAVYHIGGGN